MAFLNGVCLKEQLNENNAQVGGGEDDDYDYPGCVECHITLHEYRTGS